MKVDNIIGFIISMTVLLFCVGCAEKYELPEDIEAENADFSFSASMENTGSATKTTLSGQTLSWAVDDYIYVNKVKSDDSVTSVSDKATFHFTNMKRSSLYLAWYGLPETTSTTYSVNGSTGSIQFDFPTEQDYSQLVNGVIPMVAASKEKSTLDQQTHELNFKNACSILKFNLKGSFYISKIEVSAPLTVPLNCTVNAYYNGSSFSFTNTTKTENVSDNKITLNFPAKTKFLTYSGEDFHMLIPSVGNGVQLTIKVYSNNGSVERVEKESTITFSDGIATNKIQPLSSNVFPADALPGVFTVSASGKKVYFSRGNLQFQASQDGSNYNPKWRFATNQYDLVTRSNNSSCNETYTGWIDLFGFGTSGYHTTETYKMPYSKAGNSNEYGFQESSGSIQKTGYDWGTYNTADLGTGWYTLSKEEWQYLFTNHAYAPAEITDDADNHLAYGIIVTPDGLSSFFTQKVFLKYY